jgi:hypothetical protein
MEVASAHMLRSDARVMSMRPKTAVSCNPCTCPLIVGDLAWARRC